MEHRKMYKTWTTPLNISHPPTGILLQKEQILQTRIEEQLEITGIDVCMID